MKSCKCLLKLDSRSVCRVRLSSELWLSGVEEVEAQKIIILYFFSDFPESGVVRKQTFHGIQSLWNGGEMRCIGLFGSG